MKRVAFASILIVALLGLAACGEDESVPPAIPTWARVAPEQIAEARKHGVPVAFENTIGMRFVLIPAGTFTMGSPEDEELRDDDGTRHEVTLTKPFYVQTTEVTNAQYRRFRASHDSGKYTPADGTLYPLNGDNQPVVYVSWKDAQAFAAWLSTQETTRTYRLPTEAEWERAARAGTNTLYFFGDREQDLVRYANFSDRNFPGAYEEEQDPDDGHAVAAPVGSYDPNPWGLYDMLGNVYEWVEDRYAPYGDGAARRDPTGPSTGERVKRGGSWMTMAEDLQVHWRHEESYDHLEEIGGFRLVVTVASEANDDR